MQRRSKKDSFIIPTNLVRFNNGEGKAVIEDSVRDKDLYIISDIGNHSMTYKMYGYLNHMGPDEHFMDIKRVISAVRGQADRVTVVMPLLYESRQHRRKGRESLDCALALQELQNLGVSTIVTFDVHDPNIQNAVPTSMSFENFYPTNTILKEFIKNPIVAHNYLGGNLEGETAIVIDDMIASGTSMLEVAADLKERGARKVFLISTFSMFTNGLDGFNKAYEDGLFEKLYSTNLTYVDDNAIKTPWYKQIDCSNYASDIINTLNTSGSISELKNGKQKILTMLENKKNGEL